MIMKITKKQRTDIYTAINIALYDRMSLEKDFRSDKDKKLIASLKSIRKALIETGCDKHELYPDLT